MDNPLGTSLGKSATQVTYAKPQRVKNKQSADVQVRSCSAAASTVARKGPPPVFSQLSVAALYEPA